MEILGDLMVILGVFIIGFLIGKISEKEKTLKEKTGEK